MNAPQLPYGLEIHQVRSSRERRALCSFFIRDQMVEDPMVHFYLFRMYMLLLAVSLGLSCTDIIFDFDQLLTEPVAFLAYILKERFIKLIFYFSVLIITSTLFTVWLIYIDSSNGYWIVARNRKLVAYAKMTSRGAHTVLKSLYVARTYRRRGIGSTLVRHLLRHSALPMYLFWPNLSDPKVLSFYTKLGFQPPQESEVTPEIAVLVTSPGTPLVLNP